MLQNNVNKKATDDLARINQMIAMPRLMAGETAMLMQSLQSTQNMLNNHAAQSTARFGQSLRELDNQMAKVTASIRQSLLSTQSVLNSPVLKETASIMQSFLSQHRAINSLISKETASIRQYFLSTRSVLHSHVVQSTTRFRQSLLSTLRELDSQTAKITASIRESLLSTRSVLGCQVSKETASAMQSILSQQHVLNSQVAKVTAGIMQSTLSRQNILNSQIPDMLRITHAIHPRVFRHLDSLRAFPHTMPSLLSDTVSSICGIIHRGGFQELADIQAKILDSIMPIATHCPEIQIDRNRIWIENEEICLEDCDKAVGLDYRKIDNYIKQKWEGLPWTIQCFLKAVYQIALAYFLMIMFQNPNTTQSDLLTLDAPLDNPSHMDIQVIELTEDTLDTTDLLENQEDATEENMLIEHTCRSKSASTQIAE